MKKSIFILVLLICFISISSIAYVLTLKDIVPLDILSGFLNNILGTSGTTPSVIISVDSSKSIGSNNLSLGFFLDYPQEWKAFRDRPAQQQLAKDANFKIIHINDRHMGSLDYSKGVGPCNSWNETKKDCNKWNWADVDSVVKAIYDSGAEPMIVLSKWTGGSGTAGSTSGTPTVPPGMYINSATMLPYPSSYADFVAAWIKHFKSKGYPWNQTKYYELYGEIQTYFGWSWYQRNVTRTAYFIDLFNAAYARMHQENPQVKVSFDASTLKWVFDRLLTNGVGIDSFNFHKYDDWKSASNPIGSSNGPFIDAEMFQRAEDIYYRVNDTDTYEVDYVRRAWQKKTGVWPELTMSEGNWNGAANPTDERIQQMAGAVRTALVLRMGMLKGENYNVYFSFSSDAYWETQTWGSGRGYGLIDSDSHHTVTQSYNNPYYPYYVHKMIGPNLAVGDSIVNSYSNYNNVSSIAWTHNGKLNILLIHKSTGSKTISLSGVTGIFNYQKIDNTYPYDNAQIQTGTIDASSVITLNGYTVMLLQSSTTPTSSTTTKITTTISPTTIPPSQYSVGYWKFNDCTAKDSSGLGNDGTNYGATCIGGHSGNAFNFNGVNNYVQIPGGSSLSGFTALTVSFWIKPLDSGRRQAILNKYDNVNGSKGWFIDTPSYGGKYIGFFASPNGSNYAQWYVPFAPVLGNWYHVAVVWQANKVPTFYINGQQVSTTDTAIISSIYNNVGVPLLIGKSQYATGREFNGMIDEVKIWNRALTASEIKSEYGVVQKMIVGTDYWSGYTSSTFTKSDLPLLKDAGIQTLRIEFNSNSRANLRTLVPAVVGNGINVIGVLIRTDLAPDNVNAWGDWVNSTVNEFKNYVHVWEIWNEPNWNTGFGSPGDPVKYTQFLKAAYPRAKQADPSCTVLGGSILGTDSAGQNFLTSMYDNGAKGYMDAVSVHPYCSDVSPQSPSQTSTGKAFWKVQNMRDIMASYGDGSKKVWITEMGWRTDTVSEATQATYLQQALGIAKNWGYVDGFIVYCWMDGGSGPYGLVKTSISPKPSFYAVKDFIGTTTTIPSFTAANFVCNYVQTNNLWECSLDYTNNLNEKVIVKFYFIDSVSGGVKSIGSIWTNTGSGTVGSELSCDNYHGTYNVVWRAYRSSDSSRSNPVAFSASFKSITCS
jgi:hypothetical protein